MSTSPQWQPGGPGSAAPPATRPWYRKKRILIPAGLILAVGMAGALSDPAETADPAAAPASSATQATPSATPTKTSEAAVVPATSAPVDSPTPTVEAEPPAPAVDPYTERFGTFATVTESGTGDSVIKLPGEAALVTATHKGSSNFVIETLDASNQMHDLLVNEIGSYSGVVSYGLQTDGATMLKITADGAWSIQIAPIATAPVATSPLSGTGDAVYKYEGSAAVAAVTHSGASNFVLQQTDGTWPNLLINEIGTYQGSVPLLSGPSLLLITADGAWTIATS